MADATSIPQPCVALVTSLTLAGGIDNLVRTVSLAVMAGVNLVQMREKNLPYVQQVELARRLRHVTRDGSLFFVNDSVSVAEASGADGVQLGEQSGSIELARASVTRHLLIGRSVHDLTGAAEATAAGADLLIVGSIYASATHPGQAPAGLGLLREVTGSVAGSTPVLGIGGIGAEQVAEVIASGGTGVAVISEVFGASDPGSAAGHLCQMVSTAWAKRSRGR
jgi:thiamine-phosphate pyrophosphorylase